MALIVPAYAKLNLTLDVVGRRPNGYHEIDSVMQTISLHDLVWIERTDCRVFDVVGPSIDGENLVLKAARELEARTGQALAFTIRLFKRIPMGAGLGGGSADAAAFLKAANHLYGLRLTQAQLTEVAGDVGQDVPFFLVGGTARATDLGSTVAALPPVPASWRFLVVCPPVQVSTRAVYEAVDGQGPSARRTPKLVEALRSSPHPYTPRQAGEGEADLGSEAPTPTLPRKRGRKNSQEQGIGMLGALPQIFGNDLEPVTRRLFPAVDEAIDRLLATVGWLAMTGTGAALFAVYTTRRDGEAALAAVRQLGYPAWLCHPVPAAA